MHANILSVNYIYKYILIILQFFSVVPILKHCDEVRNKVLPNLGVRLEDQDNAPAVIKLLDAETIRKEREVSLAQPPC